MDNFSSVQSSSTYRYCIVLIQPEKYIHSAALAELAETLLYASNSLGTCFDLHVNQLMPDAINIILGAHLLDQETMRTLPDNVLIYNSEQLDRSSSWITDDYLSLLKRVAVWDYSQENIRRLQELGIAHAKHVPIGYVPELTRIPVVQKDIDVLFYGSINERRKVILEELIQQGLRVEFLTDVYREERDRYIARAKVVLNMHYYESSIFESARVSYLLANEKAVVAECNDTTSIDPSIRDAVCAVPYDFLVRACIALVKDDQKRIELEKQGFSIFSQIKESTILRQAIGLPEERLEESPLKIPKTLNLGSGKDWREEYFNTDIVQSVRPDIVMDVCDKNLFEKNYPSERFGLVSLLPGYFDSIVANDVLEHVSDLKTTMTNCLSLLRAGGTFNIQVPYDLSYGAWQDPTHVRGFNEKSWLYYTDWFWYMGWYDTRFDLTALNFLLSQKGANMQAQGIAMDTILDTPRAVDGMQVVLRKRYTTESEREKCLSVTTRPWDKAN